MREQKRKNEGETIVGSTHPKIWTLSVDLNHLRLTVLMNLPPCEAPPSSLGLWNSRDKKIVCTWCATKILITHLRQDPPPPFEAILVIFGHRALIFFVWKLLEKYEKWHHFCAHAQWWSPWRRKNVESGHLAPSNLTFLLTAIDTNGFRRMKEEGLIYKTLPQIF